MGTQDSSTTFEGKSIPDSGGDNAEWIVAKSLLSANDRTSALLEQLVLHAYTDAGSDLDPDANANQIDLVQDELDRAIEELELARSMAGELGRDDG